jgi:hypothetical protein
MTQLIRSTFVAAALFLSTQVAFAATTSGKIVIISADPDDFVVQLDTNGECGSPYFHFRRAAKNFRESVALAMTGYSTGSTMVVFVASCAGDRNIASHAYIGR